MSVARVIAAAVLCCCLTLGCAAGRPQRSETYVVRPHDTLYSIAWRHDLDYRELASWNNIGSDYRLAVGQILVLRPHTGSKAPRAASRGSAAPPSPASSSSHSTAASSAVRPAPRGAPQVGANVATPLAGAALAQKSIGSSPATAAEGSGVSSWVWPTDRSSPPRAVPGGGILLFGRLGQNVRAAGSGRVVYAGSGIRGYGNLLIIKHGDNLLSSYAHNREMLVHEGQEVMAGDVIAHMGLAPHQVTALYFEIRVNGKPTDPLRYLPPAQ